MFGIPADIGAFTEAGMTDPEVGSLPSSPAAASIAFSPLAAPTPVTAARSRAWWIGREGRIHGHTLDAGRVLVVGDTPRNIEAAHAWQSLRPARRKASRRIGPTLDCADIRAC
jgi:hypothetical protein